VDPEGGTACRTPSAWKHGVACVAVPKGTKALGDAEAKEVPSKWEKAKSEKWKWGVEGRVKKWGRLACPICQG